MIPNKTVLVTGGEGYIGSHFLNLLESQGISCISLDIKKPARVISKPDQTIRITGSILDSELVKDVFSSFQIGTIVNFAGLKSVSDSFVNPDEYFAVNFEGVNNLLKIAKNFSVVNFIQASTAALYQISSSLPVSETSPIHPISPYAESKLAAENLIYSDRYKSFFNATCLRYFNVCGSAKPDLIEVEGTNLIPSVIRQVNAGKKPKIFGKDYDTLDGTAIRDFVHVQDLVEMHLKLILKFPSIQLPKILNLGTGVGFSVQEVVNEILLQKNSPSEIDYLPRRDGDSPVVLANVDMKNRILGSNNRYSLSKIIESSIF